MKINRNITTCNRWVGRDGNAVEWIVIHYTANTYQPDLAKNECAAFADHYVGASAHFFVDDNEVWQSVEMSDSAWHCGDNPPSRNGATNRNSIGIEMCVVYINGKYSISEKTAARTLDLVLCLLKMFPAAKVCRHFDVTGKICPAPWVEDPAAWDVFRRNVERMRDYDAEMEQIKISVQKCMEEVAACKKKIADLAGKTEPVYEYPADVPEWGRATVDKCTKNGTLKGVDDTGRLNIPLSFLRLLVVIDRLGGVPDGSGR